MLLMRHTSVLLTILLSLLGVDAVAQTGKFNLEDWPQTQAPLKPLYVKAIMEQAGVHDVHFNKSAEFYLLELDKLSAFAQQHNYHAYLKTPVAQNLATIAVINCDWNNGVAHWEFAQKFLGEQQLKLLQPLYDDAIAKLKNNCD